MGNGSGLLEDEKDPLVLKVGKQYDKDDKDWVHSSSDSDVFLPESAKYRKRKKNRKKGKKTDGMNRDDQGYQEDVKPEDHTIKVKGRRPVKPKKAKKIKKVSTTRKRKMRRCDHPVISFL